MPAIRHRAKRADRDVWVMGHYFQAPLTDENSGEPQEAGWYFLAGGKTKHCIENRGGAFVIDPDTLEPIKQDIADLGWVPTDRAEDSE